MADGKLVFPVKFDLEAAVKEASGDADRVLKRLSTMINSRPLKLGIEIEQPRGGWDKKLGDYGKGSITAMRKEMAKLVEQWNKLSEAQRITDQKSGAFTADAMKIINRYSQLVTASESYARSLEQIAAAAKKSADAEIRANQKAQAELEKRKAKSQALVDMLKNEENSVTSLTARHNFYTKQMNSADKGSKKWAYNSQMVQQLKEQLDKLIQTQKRVTDNDVKATDKRLQERARIKSALLQEENSIDRVNAKLKIWHNIMNRSIEGSGQFAYAAKEIERLNGVVDRLNANTPRAQQKAQEQLQREWLAAKDQREREREKETQQAIANANRENQARQAAYNAQRQAGLERQRILQAEENSIAAVTAKLQLQQQRLNEAKVGSAKYGRLTEEVDRLTRKLHDMQEALAAAGKRIEALRALREVLTASEKTISGLTGKLQVYQERLKGLEVGSQKFNKTAAEVRRLSEELQRANQYLNDFQSKAFRGLSTNFTAQQTEAVQNLRRQIDYIDKKFNMLYQNGRATNADGTYTDRVNIMLKERMRLQEEINKMMKTAADAQLEREKEINRIQEQRKAKAQAIADKKKAETKATQQNIAKLKEERRVLNQQESSIKAITDKLNIMQNRLNSANMKSGQFEKIAKEVDRLTKKLDEARRKVAELTGQSTSGANTQARNARKVSQEYSKQLTYLDRLVRRMAVYGSIGLIGNFLRNVREVTAQFELQRVSLGAILQDQTKANQLFSEIKGFALKSPVSILDLTKYTKQLAAYKIGYDELFETTKKLTDVSVGLGVSMDRVVLAYGQVRATGHLRASEIRQFTEMGVPIVEELAAKLSKMNGELVTAADVMDMVSKRAIGFDMVKEVFDDMTSAGGIFYNMQEKQGNTLYGLWAKLGDAASVMYDEIGRTGAVNATMKGLIQGSTDLMKNWRLVSGEVAVAVLGFGAYKVAQNLATKSTIAASAAADNYTRAQIRMRAATMAHNDAQRLSAVYSMKSARAYHIAAQSTNVWTAAKYKLIGATNSLKAALMGNWITLTITAVAAIGAAIYSAYEKANRLRNALTEIREETTVLQNQSTRNFERLVKQATENADGSKKQKEALDELNRTYKDMVPEEALRIENLRKMKGNYEELTQAVREYIAAQQEEKSINTINEQEGAVQTAMQKRLRGVFEKQGFSSDEIERFFRAFERTALDTSKTVKEQFEEALEIAGLSGGEKLWNAVKDKMKSWFTVGASRFNEEAYVRSHSAIGELSRSIAEQQNQIEAVRKSYADMTQDLGIYTGAMRNYNQAVQKNLNSGETMLQNQENVNMQIRYMTSWIKDAVKEAGIAWNEGWSEIIKDVDAEDLNRISSLNMEAILSAIDPNKHPELYKYIQSYKKMYEDLVPSDPVAKQIRARFFEIANSTGVSIDTMRRFLWDGKTALDDHIKSLDDQITKYEADIYRMNAAIAKGGILGNLAQMIFGGKIEEQTKMLEALRELMNFEKTYVKEKETKSKGGRQSDPRLQNLKEEISLVQKLYQEYKQLEKQEGATNATSDMNRMAKDTIAMLSKKYGIGLPKTATDVVTALEILYGKMEQLPRKVFPSLDKDLKELRWTIEKVDIDDSQKNIEAELKKLADRISRTKTAREFYDKILSQTGDIDLAMNVTMSVYGDTGEGLFDNIVEQIRQTFSSGNQEIDLQITTELDTAIDTENQRINYQILADIYDKYQDQIIEKNRQTAENIIKEGQKTAAANISTWEKELAKAKDYEQQRTDIINHETQRRAEVIKSFNYTPKEKEEKLKQSRKKQDEEIAKVNFEEFTKSEDYIKIFENLDNTSTAALKRLREEMRKLIETNKGLSPENMKTLVKAMEDIDEQISGRGFGNDMVQGVRDYIGALRDLKTAKAELQTAQAEYDEQLPQLDADIETAKAEEIAAQGELNALKAQELQDANAIVAAELRLNNATKTVEIAEQSKAKAADKVKKAVTKVTNQQDKQRKASGKFFADLQKTVQTADQLASVLGDVEALLAISADSAAGVAFDSAIEGLQTFSKTMNVIIGLQELYNIVTESNPWIAIAAAVLAVGSMLGAWITNNKVRKANLEIERQQELLEGLQYTYSRLEKVADKVFGRDYISNYNQEMTNLQAQAAAYQKQAEAEKSKGKKTDKEKLKEYENAYRDTMDEIADMQTQLVEKFTGTNRQDVARQMAQSWIDARVSMSDTFAAIKGDYSEMIKNMIVEGVAARIIENALTPMWDKMDAMLKDNNIDGAIDSLIGGMDDALNAANNGMEVLWKALEARGYDMKQLIGDTDESYTGIAKNVASATSEEINANTAALNTQNYYLSHVPVIGENVAAIRMILQGGSATVSSGTGAATTIDYTDLLTAANQHLASLPRMERHLSDIYLLLSKVVVFRGNGYVINSFMRS